MSKKSPDQTHRKPSEASDLFDRLLQWKKFLDALDSKNPHVWVIFYRIGDQGVSHFFSPSRITSRN